MTNTVKSFIHRRTIVLVLLFLAFAGCSGGSGGGGGGAATKSGTVAQGAVDGALVFADHLSGTEANYAMDGDETLSSTTTDSTGRFTISSPGYSYMIVSTGGTDVISGQPAMQMLAPAGAENISPFTTLVALNPDSRNVIESLGIPYDSDISANITPAAAIVVQSIQAAVFSVTGAFTNLGSLPFSRINNIQREVLTQIAIQLQGSNVSSLTTPSTLASTIGLAVTSALTSTVVNSTATFSNVPAVTSAVTTAVELVAANIMNSAGTGTTGGVAESTLIDSTRAQDLNFIIAVAYNDAISNGGIVLTAMTNTAPTISGAPATTATAGVTYRFTPTVVDDAGEVLLFYIDNKPDWATFNTATGELTGTPTAGDEGIWPGIIISVTDGMSFVSLDPAFDITVISLTGSSGG